MNTCPCGCGAAVPVYPACGACGRETHADLIGPDGRCVACWEAEMAPSERHGEATRLMGRALDAWADRYGEHRAAASYPSGHTFTSARDLARHLLAVQTGARS